MSHCISPRRQGAVLPLFAILLPVLVLLCAFAINVAYMQLTTTELRIATDSAARAGGRAWSEFQTVGQAKQFARQAAQRNTVAGQPLRLSGRNADNEIEFGTSNRLDNGFGRYVFTKQDTGQVNSGAVRATAIRINGRRTADSRSGSIALLFGGVGATTTFEPIVSSVCTQVDRDIAMVLDKSGSMAYYQDEEALKDAIQDLRNRGRISSSEYNSTRCTDDSATGLYNRLYEPDVVAQLPAEMAEYAVDMNEYNGWRWNSRRNRWDKGSSGSAPAPRHSRWDSADIGRGILHQRAQYHGSGRTIVIGHV